MKSLNRFLNEKNVTQEETENEIKIHIDKLVVNNSSIEDIIKALADMGYDSNLVTNLVNKTYKMKSLKDLVKENINESKNIKPEDLERTVEIHLDTVYNDGYDSPQKAQKALKELAEKGECEMLDYLTAAIDAHDGDIKEDDLLDNWDAYVAVAQKFAKEWSK